MNDLRWYILGGMILSFIFVCGYKIGHIRGWRHGYNDYGTVLEQRNRFRGKSFPSPQDDWDYRPKEKAAARVNEQPLVTMQERQNSEQKGQCN